MPPSTHPMRPAPLRIRLLAVGAVLLLGYLGLAAHAVQPHGDHGPGQGCDICLQLGANPAVMAAAPDLPMPRPSALAAPAAPARPLAARPVAVRSRAPPAVFTVS